MARGVIIPARITHRVEVGMLMAIEDYEFFIAGNVTELPLPVLGVTLVVNSEAKRRGFEHNARASFLRWYFTSSRARLHGDIVVVGLNTEAGRLTVLSPEQIALFTQQGEFRIETKQDPTAAWADYGEHYSDYLDAIVMALIINERPTVEHIRVVGQVESGISAPTKPE